MNVIPEYPWLELVGIRVPKNGEWVIHPEDEVIEASELGYVYPIVKPNNAYNVLRLEDLKIPEGYEQDGETLKDAFRVPTAGHPYLSSSGVNHVYEKGIYLGLDPYRLCLRKIAPKTKRVLVVECDEPWHNIPPASVSVTYHGQTLPATSFRIEERPL